MGKAAKFWDRVALRYSKKPIADEAAYQQKLEITRSHFQPEMQLLEFGCGTGSTALIHAPHVKHIKAIDISKKMIEIAERKREASGIKNVSFECQTIDDLDEPDNSFDVILGLSILHLLRNWRETISKVYCLLKPGGLFVSSTACIADSMRIFKLIAPIGKFFGVLPELDIFTKEELEDGLQCAGFEIEHQWQPGKNKGVFILARKPV